MCSDFEESDIVVTEQLAIAVYETVARTIAIRQITMDGDQLVVVQKRDAEALCKAIMDVSRLP